MSHLPKPTPKSLRDFMRRVLPTDADFNAFCVDTFPQIKQQFSSGMLRMEKEDYLLSKVSTEEILQALRSDYASSAAKYQHELKWVSESTAPSAPPSIEADLKRLIQITAHDVRSCLERLDTTVELNGMRATGRFHFLPIDKSGKPDTKRLCRLLSRKLSVLCLSAKTRSRFRVEYPDEYDVEIWLKVRDRVLRKKSPRHVGELLLSVILEAFYEAPQVVCKMELNHNRTPEEQEASGIHARWGHANETLQLLFAKSHLHKNIDDAFGNTLEYMNQFCRADQESQELHLVTAEFQFLNPSFQQLLTSYIENPAPDQRFELTHACLIGFDWSEFQQNLVPSTFRTLYTEYSSDIRRMMDEKFSNFPHRNLTYDFLFLPFHDVSSLSETFYRSLTGEVAE